MAIAENALIEFYGTQDDLSNTTSAVTDGSLSDGTNDLSAWTNDDDAPQATVALTCQYPSGTLDTVPYIVLHARLIDVDGTNDTAVPTASHSPHKLGTFLLNPSLATTTNDTMVIEVSLPNTETSQVYNLYIENQTGVSISASWALKITPKTVGPHPA